MFPLISLIFFLLCACNIAAPPTLNLLSEIFLIGRILKYDFIIILLFPLGSYLGALFTLYLFSYSQHGKFSSGFISLYKINFREIHLMVLHLFPLRFLFLNINYYLFIY
jgi:NADH-ubiquinone oxidoreductase chain 4